MLVRTDPLRELDRVAAQILESTGRSTTVPMDAWRDGETFVIEFDLPGVDPQAIEVDVERNVLSVRADRLISRSPGSELVVGERVGGSYRRQVLLGEALDASRIRAFYDAGVLRLNIAMAEAAKPRRIDVEAPLREPNLIDA